MTKVTNANDFICARHGSRNLVEVRKIDWDFNERSHTQGIGARLTEQLGYVAASSMILTMTASTSSATALNSGVLNISIMAVGRIVERVKLSLSG